MYTQKISSRSVSNSALGKNFKKDSALTAALLPSKYDVFVKSSQHNISFGKTKIEPKEQVEKRINEFLQTLKAMSSKQKIDAFYQQLYNNESWPIERKAAQWQLADTTEKKNMLKSIKKLVTEHRGILINMGLDKKEDCFVRIGAVQQLKHLNQKDMLDILNKTTTDTFWPVVKTASNQLRYLKNQNARLNLAKKIMGNFDEELREEFILQNSKHLQGKELTFLKWVAANDESSKLRKLAEKKTCSAKTSYSYMI